MKTLTVRAPAKINLYLRILGKRADGYHNIETIFEKINLCDKVVLKRRKKGIRIVCPHKDVPVNQRNLGFRAARALLRAAKRQDGVEIRIDKRIPVAAGLGGGSSDAASVLLGLNKLLSTGLRLRQLLDLGAKLGADVPFFLLSRPRAVGRGKGEILRPLKINRKNWYVLVVPPFKVSTRRMYQDAKITLTKSTSGVRMIIRALEKGDLTALNKYGYNSFAPVLKKRYKQILQINKALKSSGASATLVSGSGPCVFGVTKNRKEAMGISKNLRAKKDWQVIVAKTFSN